MPHRRFVFGWFVCLVGWFSRFGFPSLSLSLSFLALLRIGGIPDPRVEWSRGNFSGST